MRCHCGCNEITSGGNFKPGHDQKLRSKHEGQTGGLLALKKLVEAAKAYSSGSASEEEFLALTRQTMAPQKD